MSKKSNTVIFTIVSTILNIIMTLVIIVLLVLGVSAFYFKILGKTQPGTGLAIAWMVCFLVGLVLGMFLFAKIGSWVIDRFNMADKLDPRFLGKYLPSGKKNPNFQETKKKTTTNIPHSALAVEDDQWAKDIENGVSASEDLNGATEDVGSQTDSE